MFYSRLRVFQEKPSGHYYLLLLGLRENGKCSLVFWVDLSCDHLFEFAFYSSKLLESYTGRC